MSMVAEISIDYIGSCLSVNHYKYRGKFTKPETKVWMQVLRTKTRRGLRYSKVKLPPTIHLTGIFKDKRSCPDLANLHKVIGDALQDCAPGMENDREFRFVDEGYTIDKSKEPTLIIGIEVEAAI